MDRSICSSNFTAALALADLGLFILPCRSDKTPLIKDWPTFASADEKVTRGWWQQFSTAVPAIACGPSSLLVIDCDLKNGKDGVSEWLRQCEKNALDLNACPVVETPSGGRHYYFRQLPGAPLGNTAGRIGEGIDTRGAGGYIIAPGAVLPDGRSYRLLAGSLNSVPPLPVRLREHLAAFKAEKADDRGMPLVLPAPNIVADVERERSYALKALEREAQAVATAAKGSRNDLLNRSAFNIGTLIPRGAITKEEAEVILAKAAMQAGLTEGEVRATIRSGFDAGMTFPRPSLAEQSAQLQQRVEMIGLGPTPPNVPPLEWSDPKALPPELLPVETFQAAYLPTEVSEWVTDIAERMQCPPDFVAVSVIVALGATIGRQVAIRPKRGDGWTEFANLWGLVIGRPGVMKSPAMGEALKPLKLLEKK